MPSLFVDALLGGRTNAMDQVGIARDARSKPAPTSAAGAAASLDFDKPKDNLYAFGKIWAGYDEPQIGGFHGLMYARIGGQRLMPLFGYTGTGCM